MKDCNYKLKHFDNVFGRGYPVFLVTIYNFQKEDNTLIELMRLFVNYNSEKFEFDYKYASTNLSPKSDEDSQVFFDWGFDYLKQSLNNEILESDNELQKNALPLKELDISYNLFQKIKTSPSFDEIKSRIVDESGCTELIKKIDQYSMIKFNLK